MPQFGEGSSFDLANSFPREIEHLADIGESARFAFIEAEPEHEDLALGLLEQAQRIDEMLSAHDLGGVPERVRDPVVLNEILEFRVALLADGAVRETRCRTVRTVPR